MAGAWIGTLYRDGDFEYEDTTHVYTKAGRVVPGVSTILTPIIDFGDAPIAAIKNAAIRGKHVHRVCELHDEDDLDMESIDPRLWPYYKGYLKFLEDWEPDWTVIERPEYSETFRFAGTPDRRGYLRRRMEKGRMVPCSEYRICGDLKATYALNDHVGPQLSGYDILDPLGYADELWSIRLTKSGSYERHVHPAEHAVFMACLTVFNTRTKYGLTYPKW